MFSYLDYKDMNRWITDPTKAPAFDRAYGDEGWRGAVALPERERRRYLLDRHKAALKDPKRGGATYVTSFTMFDGCDQPLYWLIFCTNNLRGLEEMTKAMWAVDGTGAFRFSDEDDTSQQMLFDQRYDDVWLAGELATRLAGRTMSVLGVKEYVLTDTPCYLFKAALRSLEVGARTARITKAPPGRRPGTYPDELYVFDRDGQLAAWTPDCGAMTGSRSGGRWRTVGGTSTRRRSGPERQGRARVTEDDQISSSPPPRVG